MISCNESPQRFLRGREYEHTDNYQRNPFPTTFCFPTYRKRILIKATGIPKITWITFKITLISFISPFPFPPTLPIPGNLGLFRCLGHSSNIRNLFNSIHHVRYRLPPILTTTVGYQLPNTRQLAGSGRSPRLRGCWLGTNDENDHII